jgi:outer membrane lipoprotein SlyB
MTLPLSRAMIRRTLDHRTACCTAAGDCDGVHNDKENTMRYYFNLACTLIAISLSQAAFAACPPADSTAGGWTPPSCISTSGPAASSPGLRCPDPNAPGGGWVPPACYQDAASCPNCGTIEAINIVEEGQASGAGAVAGAVAGGVAGNKLGGKKNKKLGTLLGAVGGAVGGHYAEKYLRKGKRWDVIVQLNDESHKTISFESEPPYKVGDRVKVDGDKLTTY